MIRRDGSGLHLIDILEFIHDALFEFDQLRYLISSNADPEHSICYIAFDEKTLYECHHLLAKRLQYAVTGRGRVDQLRITHIPTDKVPQCAPSMERMTMSEHGLCG